MSKVVTRMDGLRDGWRKKEDESLLSEKIKVATASCRFSVCKIAPPKRQPSIYHCLPLQFPPTAAEHPVLVTAAFPVLCLPPCCVAKQSRNKILCFQASKEEHILLVTITPWSFPNPLVTYFPDATINRIDICPLNLSMCT